MTLGETIKNKRKVLGMTQKELASKVEVDFSYISKIEKGNAKMPSKEVLAKVAQALELNENELYFRNNQIPDGVHQIIISDEKVIDFLTKISNRKVSDREWEAINKIIC